MTIETKNGIVQDSNGALALYNTVTAIVMGIVNEDGKWGMATLFRERN